MKSNMVSVLTAVSVGLALSLLTLLGFYMYLNKGGKPNLSGREEPTRKATTTTTK